MFVWPPGCVCAGVLDAFRCECAGLRCRHTIDSDKGGHILALLCVAS